MKRVFKRGYSVLQVSIVVLVVVSLLLSQVAFLFGTALAAVTPTMQTNAATNLTSTSATLNGIATANGGADITYWGFKWGTDPNNLTKTGNEHYGTLQKNTPFADTITGLTPNTTYYFQAFGKNSADTGYGILLSFTTLSSQNQGESYQFLSKWGSRGSADGQLYNPSGITADNKGHIYVTDTSNNRVQEFTVDGAFITKWGSYGWGDGQFCGPTGIAVDGSGNVYVVDSANARIQKFTARGTFITSWGGFGSADGQFRGPYGIAVDGNGNVYVADTGNHRIEKFDSSGRFITKWGMECAFGAYT